MKTINSTATAKKIAADHGLILAYVRGYKMSGNAGGAWMLVSKHGGAARKWYATAALADMSVDQFYIDCEYVACNSMTVEQMSKVVDRAKFNAAQKAIDMNPAAIIPDFAQLGIYAVSSDKQVHAMEDAIYCMREELEALHGSYAEHKAAHAVTVTPDALVEIVSAAGATSADKAVSPAYIISRVLDQFGFASFDEVCEKLDCLTYGMARLGQTQDGNYWELQLTGTPGFPQSSPKALHSILKKRIAATVKPAPLNEIDRAAIEALPVKPTTGEAEEVEPALPEADDWALYQTMVAVHLGDYDVRNVNAVMAEYPRTVAYQYALDVTPEQCAGLLWDKLTNDEPDARPLPQGSVQ